LIEWFGSVGTTMMTCFRVITGGDDWGAYYDALKPTGFVNSVIFLFFIMFSQLALLNIVTGVFVENAMKASQPELAALAFEQRKRDLADAAVLRELFTQIDVDQSGTISSQEWTNSVQHDHNLRYRLAVMGLDIKDAMMFFNMLMEIGSDIEIDVDFFVDACLKMKGHASSIDLNCLAYETKVIHHAVRRAEAESSAMRDFIKDFVEREANRKGGAASDGGACGSEEAAVPGGEGLAQPAILGVRAGDPLSAPAAASAERVRM